MGIYRRGLVGQKRYSSFFYCKTSDKSAAAKAAAFFMFEIRRRYGILIGKLK